MTPSRPGYMKLKTDLDGVWILATVLDSLEIMFNEGTSCVRNTAPQLQAAGQ